MRVPRRRFHGTITSGPEEFLPRDKGSPFKSNYEMSSTGRLTVNGRIFPTTVTDDTQKIGQDDDEHDVLSRFFSPLLDHQIREIAQEVAEMRIAGTLRPFKEGEPVGVIPRRVRLRPPTDKQVRDFNNKLREARREDMLRLRAKNDTIIREILSS